MKGQVSIEAVIAVAILLVFFTIIATTQGTHDMQTNLLKEKLQKENECERVAGILSELFAQSGRTQITFQINEDANFSGQIITMGSTTCLSLSKIEDSQTARGFVRAKKVSETVSIENA